MAWRIELRSVLTNSVAVGNVVGDRIYPNIIPEGVDLPAVAYTVTENTPANHKDGSTKLDFATVEFDLVSTKYSEIADGSEAIREALTSYTGTEVARATLQDETEFYDDKNKYHRINQEYLITIKRT